MEKEEDLEQERLRKKRRKRERWGRQIEEPRNRHGEETGAWCWDKY